MSFMRTFGRPLLVAVLFTCAAADGLWAGEEREPVRLLLLSGQSNHDWKSTTPLIEQAFTESGRFVVEITEHPETLTAEQLERFDVLVSNWNSFHRETPPPAVDWPEAARAAYLDFVRGGKGHVVVHAGSSSFYHDRDWPAYHELVMARYGFEMTAHGVQHIFPVRVEAGDHPITSGMGGFTIHDELWHSAWVVPGATVLASAYSSLDSRGSGRYEPIVFVRDYGKGRSFTILLGHGPRALTNPAFKGFLCRGAEWAATGSVTLPLPERIPHNGADVLALDASVDDALAAIAKYRFGRDRTPLMVVQSLVEQVAGDPGRAGALADRMAAMLEGDATVESKRFLCRQLARIGSARHAKALSPLLHDAHLALFARGALESIPGEVATVALSGALTASDSPDKLGLIASLGRRGDASSVSVLAGLTTVEDESVRHAAITALGCIGDAAAVDAIMALRADLPGGSRAVWADALLRRARQRTETGMPAAHLYDTLTEPGFAEHVRAAAFAGLLGEAVPPRGKAFVDALRSADGARRRGAVNALRDGGLREELAAVALQLGTFPTDLQWQMIPLLGQRGTVSALPAITAAATHAESDVRREALVALGAIGDASTVAVLLGRLESASKAEAGVIADSLARLRGSGVDERMISLLGAVPPGQARALIAALVARSVTASIPLLVELAHGDDAEVADDAVDALGKLGGAEVCKALIALLADDSRAADTDAVQRSITRISRGLSKDPARRILLALQEAPPPLAAKLMPILKSLGGDDALAAVCRRIETDEEELRDAAVRALAAWPDPTALEPVTRLAADTPSAVERTLAIRGFARLFPAAEDLDRGRRCAMFERMMKLASRTDEKRALLACAPAAPSLNVLEWVTECLREPGLSGEASLAAVAVVEVVAGDESNAAAHRLRDLYEAVDDPALHNSLFRRLRKLYRMGNLARHAKADSPDGLTPDLGGQEADAAIDGDLATYWDEQNDREIYRFRLVFDVPVKIAHIAITGYRHHYAAPSGFTVLCDGEAVAQVDGAAYIDNFLAIGLPETEARELVLEITSYYGPSPGIRELEVYGPLPVTEEAVTSEFQWLEKEGSLGLLVDGRPLWVCRFGDQSAKPYFHPIATPAGVTLTAEAPEDHPWHHGHWFSWKFINGVNYWEEDRKTGKAAGETLVERVRVAREADFGARIEIDLTYQPAGGPTVMREERVIEVSEPRNRRAYYIDWTQTFTAGDREVVLDRTPLPDEPGGKTWGGYGGLAFRFVNDFDVQRAVPLDGGEVRWQDDRHRSRSPAMEMNATIAGRVAGVAILNHPESLNAPTPWYLIDSEPMKYMNPAVLCYGPHTLRAGESLTLRYRVVVHDGALSAEDLQRHYHEYATNREEQPSRVRK